MKTPVAGLVVGAFVSGPAVVLITTARYWDESLALAVSATICVLMVPVSAVVAVFTCAGFRLGREIVAGRPVGARATGVAGLAGATFFGGLLFAACSLVFEGFRESYFAAPVIGAVVGSLAGAFCDLLLTSRSSKREAPPVVPLEAD